VRTVACVCLFSGGLLVSGAQAEPVDMQPGQWQITTTVKVEGLPADSPMPSEPPPQVVERCLTLDDLVPKPGDGQPGCKVTEEKVLGDTVKWEVACDAPEGGAQGRGTGTITYSGDSFEGAFIMKMQLEEGGDTTTMTSRLEGKRLGDCEE
jgi:hypothetical protein